VSLISAGCVFWLEALRPLFATTALAAIVWQAWLIWRRPRARRTRTLVIFAISVAVNALVVLSWAALWWRYR
jgi:hypothetical protein